VTGLLDGDRSDLRERAPRSILSGSDVADGEHPVETDDSKVLIDRDASTASERDTQPLGER
jgi:hypothetical protein